MSDSLLNKYAGRVTPNAASQFETDTSDDMGCFGWLRGVRDRAVMLELRKKTGAVMAIGYAWLERVEYDPPEGITIHAAGRTIRIKGRNLGGDGSATMTLFGGLIRHRVPWVQELDRYGTIRNDSKGSVVEHIDWV